MAMCVLIVYYYCYFFLYHRKEHTIHDGVCLYRAFSHTFLPIQFRFRLLRNLGSYFFSPSRVYYYYIHFEKELNDSNLLPYFSFRFNFIFTTLTFSFNSEGSQIPLLSDLMTDGLFNRILKYIII
jgi:hypothetical protein